MAARGVRGSKTPGVWTRRAGGTSCGMQLSGFHHVTAITADASANHAFYTGVLGLRLVKKTVNQDDVSAYHLFYADGRGSPGTDITFFDWPVPRERQGTASVVRTGFRVRSEETLGWWLQRFDEARVEHGPIVERDGRRLIDFSDPEGQRLSLVAEEAPRVAHPWPRSPVPVAHQILGLGPVMMSVPRLGPTDRMLTAVLNMRSVRQYPIDTYEAAATVSVYEMASGGAAGELHVCVEPHVPAAAPGAGGVHHVAFRTPDVGEYRAWEERLRAQGIASSGPVDRYYFRSLYFRDPGGVLFEIATDGPGFAADEPVEQLGEQLALPPFLEARRAEIERRLKPL